MSEYKDVEDWSWVSAQNFEAAAFGYVHWISCAKKLLASSEALRPKVVEFWESHRAYLKDKTTTIGPDFYQGPYFMLVAYAIENLFKAALVRDRSTEYRRRFRSEGKFPDALRSHNLIDLATKAGFVFSFEEEDLLRRLTRNALWYGRYPTPVRYKEMLGTEEFSDGETYLVSWYGGTDLERIERLVEKIRRELRLLDY